MAFAADARFTPPLALLRVRGEFDLATADHVGCAVAQAIGLGVSPPVSRLLLLTGMSEYFLRGPTHDDDLDPAARPPGVLRAFYRRPSV
jgi:hypothetical protein